jgi:hypothetical protein
LSQPIDGFGIRADLHFAQPTCKSHLKARRSARREAQSIVDMRLSLCAATHKILGEADDPMRVSQIAIQRQRPFSHARGRAASRLVDLN